MNRSSISWLVNADGTKGYTWSPTSGCSPASAGCLNCWAKAYHVRYRGGDFSVKLHPEKLDEPLRLRKPSTIGVCLMGDLLHRDVSTAFVALVLAQIRVAERHTFVLLTKRIDRLQKMLTRYEPEPPRNLWIGTSVEDQRTADERIPILLDTPAANRWVSLEPQIGPVDLGDCFFRFGRHAYFGLNFVVQGSESGPRRRPFDVDWARQVRDACKAAGVPYALKQMPASECRDEGGVLMVSEDKRVLNTIVEKPKLDGKVEWSLPWVKP